ncbi:hypothetical protein ACOSP7_018337 [Xanthoceras sorbifolium]|uniref:Transmembrane protein n=1 Tax=Xanthoceras sorbifolium TaxID=99658 RepID=A0ABQ8I0X9_9ROSI|nr:hypothetical protein JRO89_XS05G0081900 [Xanthoceras sorbifolium]
MSMATQPQQPATIYPTVTMPPPSSSSHHSNGSFGTVFIVLAVIVVLSGISCCLGRVCNRRFHKQRPPKQSHGSRSRGRERDLEFEPNNKQNHMNPNFRPRERETDLEFGFDKNIAASKPVVNGQPRGFKMSDNGDIKFDPKFVSFAEAKASA